MSEPIYIGDVLDYNFDWRGSWPGPWLEDAETVTDVVASVTGPLEIVSSSSPADVVRVWVTTTGAAKDGQAARIKCQITTSLGRTKTATIDVRIGVRGCACT